MSIRRAISLNCLLLSIPTAVFVSQATFGQGLTYVEADAFNMTELADINGVGGTPGGTDNLWFQRTGFGAGGTIFEAGTSIEDAAQLTQTVFGLTPFQSYDFYAVYWTDIRENWGISAGSTSGNLTSYNFYSESGAYPIPGTPQGFTAGAAMWIAPPPPTNDISLNPQPASYVFTQRTASVPIVMLLAPVGEVVADEFGQAQIFIDDTPVGMTSGRWRTWYDGVAYTDPGTVVAMTAAIDRLTGELTVTNPTSSNFHIRSVSLRSASGELIGENWDPITGRLDGSVGGDMTFDTDEWAITTPANPAIVPYALQLTEAEVLANNGVGGTLLAGGGSLSFGEGLVRRTAFEDVLVYLTLADDTLAILSPDYVNGERRLFGDFDSDGDIDLVDYQTLLSSMHGSVAGTLVQRHEQGDISGNGLVNFVDFAAFRAAFEDFNGEGSFAAMTAQVPEPSGWALLLVCGLVLGLAKRRTVSLVMFLTVSLAMACNVRAVTYLSVDIDDRNGDEVAGPPGDNTVPGFHSFTMTGVVNSTTRVLGDYTVAITGRNASNVLTCCIDDRDRSQPNTAPTLNQLYDDFIFTAGGVGLNGGINVEVSGGLLLPNKHYEVVLYAYDASSTGNRVANWTDGNNSNVLVTQTLFAGATANHPTTDEQYGFVGYARTDATGKLQLRGRSAMPVATDAGLFLNGFQVRDALAISLEVNTSDGTIQFVNHSGVELNMSYYEIRSASGALNNTSWTSLDAAEGPVETDPIGSGWDQTPNLSPNLLSEINLQSMLAFDSSGAGSFASLGTAFTPGPSRDVEFFYAAPGETTLKRGIVSYVTQNFNPIEELTGDYNDDGVVDARDYVVWRDNFGSMAILPGDPIGGEIGDGQYDQWAANFGATPPGSGSATGAAIPEPTSIVLLLLAAMGGLAKSCRFVKIGLR